MKWRRETAHMMLSDEGYKICRNKVGENTYYRPSVRGEFIGPPLGSADEAKAECEQHFERGGK